MAKAVLWDMDGVIVDTELILQGVTAAMLRDRGVILPPGYLNQFRAVAKETMFAKIKEDYPQVKDDVAALVTEKKKRNKEATEHPVVVPLLSGARELIMTLHEMGIPQTICTSSNKDSIPGRLNPHDVLRFLKQPVAGDEFPTEVKPHPRLFLEGAKRLGQDPKECIVIEDSDNGIVAAKAAGMTAVLLDGGRPYIADYERNAADYVIHSPLELLDLKDKDGNFLIERHRVEGCQFCSTDESRIIKRYAFWTLITTSDQRVLGRTYARLNRHYSNFGALTPGELTELGKVVSEAQNMDGKMFGAEKVQYNILQLGFKLGTHIHVHILPRYPTPRIYEGQEFRDENFTESGCTDYSTKERKMPPEFLAKLTLDLRKKI